MLILEKQRQKKSIFEGSLEIRHDTELVNLFAVELF